jgi:hypothetical protein
MAFFAMLAVLASPALAFACCCAKEIAPVTVTQTLASPVQATGNSHPGCDGHAAVGDVRAQDRAASRVSTSTFPQTAPIAAPTQTPCFQSVCECAHTSNSTLAFVAEQNSSSFSPLVSGAAIQAFSLALNSAFPLRFAFASNAARPRGPDLASRAGRAPPAFSL